MTPGIRSTEAWITLALILLASLLVAFQPAMPEGGPTATVAALVLAGLAGSGYTASRTVVKAVDAWRTGGLTADRLLELARGVVDPEEPIWDVTRGPGPDEPIRIKYGEAVMLLDPASLIWRPDTEYARQVAREVASAPSLMK